MVDQPPPNILSHRIRHLICVKVAFGRLLPSFRWTLMTSSGFFLQVLWLFLNQKWLFVWLEECNGEISVGGRNSGSHRQTLKWQDVVGENWLQDQFMSGVYWRSRDGWGFAKKPLSSNNYLEGTFSNRSSKIRQETFTGDSDIQLSAQLLRSNKQEGHFTWGVKVLCYKLLSPVLSTHLKSPQAPESTADPEQQHLWMLTNWNEENVPDLST